ncbi:hypothetical protein KDA11_02275 [Candidatus Saccharibacteria bacterium]|nr:hypothetical protein [Candidatus Saccharibacteria bacterium]
MEENKNLNSFFLSDQANRWLNDESAGDPNLLDMLIQREELIDKIASRDPDSESLVVDLMRLYSYIVTQKHRLGLLESYSDLGTDYKNIHTD